jgi:hypothetical protein
MDEDVTMEEMERDIYGDTVYDIMVKFGEDASGTQAGICEWRDLMVRTVDEDGVKQVAELPVILRSWFRKQNGKGCNSVDARMYKKLVKLGLNVELREVKCRNCAGTGKQKGYQGSVYTCYACAGHGTVESWVEKEQ